MCQTTGVTYTGHRARYGILAVSAHKNRRIARLGDIVEIRGKAGLFLVDDVGGKVRGFDFCVNNHKQVFDGYRHWQYRIMGHKKS